MAEENERRKKMDVKSKIVTRPCDDKCCMLVVEKCVYGKNDVDYNISIQDSRYDHNYNTIWGRICRAASILFSRPIYYNDLLLTGEEKFHDFVKELEELEKFGTSEDPAVKDRLNDKSDVQAR